MTPTLLQNEEKSHLGPLIFLSAILACIYFVFSTVVQYWRLRHIPGPPLAAWTNFWLMRQLNGTEKFYDVKKRLHQEYGPVQRYGSNRVMFSDVSAVHSVLPASNSLPKVCDSLESQGVCADRYRLTAMLHSKRQSMARRLHHFSR